MKDKKKIIKLFLYNIIAAICLGISIEIFAVNANFAPGGVTGIAVIFNYLFNLPIGALIILINIPIVIGTYKKLGKNFFIYSIISILICSFVLDYVMCYIPKFTGSRFIASIFSGVFAGIGYSILFNSGSSTGGTDFIIAAIKKDNDNLSFGMLAFFIDSIVIIISIFIFKEIGAFIYGMLYTIITSITMDVTTKYLLKIEK